MSSSQSFRTFKASKSALAQIHKLDKKLKRGKLTPSLVTHVLNEEDLVHWVLTPSSLLLQSKDDKMREVIILMAYLGLRVSEAIAFDWTQQFKGKQQTGFILTGKGSKQRRIFNVFDHDYIKLKMNAVHTHPDLFLTNQQQYQVGRSGVFDHLRRRSLHLNWSWTPTPHDFRRCFATRLLYEKQINPTALQNLLGHAFYMTTEKYIRRDPRLLEHSLTQSGLWTQKGK
jgi:integrase